MRTLVDIGNSYDDVDNGIRVLQVACDAAEDKTIREGLDVIGV